MSSTRNIIKKIPHHNEVKPSFVVHDSDIVDESAIPSYEEQKKRQREQAESLLKGHGNEKRHLNTNPLGQTPADDKEEISEKRRATHKI